MPSERSASSSPRGPSYSRIKTALRAIARAPRPRAAARRRRVGAARSLRQRRFRRSSATGSTIAARVYMVVEGENLVTSAKSTGLGLVGAGDGLRQPQARRRRDDRRPLRDARHRGRGVVHEHPGRPRAGRRGHRIDRREGAPRGHQAVEPAPRLDASWRGRARHAAGRGAGDRGASPAARRSTSPPSRGAARRSTSIRS